MNQSYKVSFFTVSFLLLVSIVYAQNTKIDSLKSIVETRAKDTSMVNALNALSNEVLNNEDISQSIIYAKKANELANQLNYQKGLAYSLKNIGLVQYYQGKYLDVLNSWSRSLKVFETIHDTIGIANLVNNLGAIYYSQGSNAKALDYYLRSLSISEKIKDNYNTAQTLLNIGGLYAEMNNFDKALEYYNQIKNYRDKLNNAQINLGYLLGVGEIYFEKGLYDDALKYYNEALTANQIITLRADNLIKIAKVLLKKNNHKKANEFLNEAYQIAKSNNQQLEVVLI